MKDALNECTREPVVPVEMKALEGAVGELSKNVDVLLGRLSSVVRHSVVRQPENSPLDTHEERLVQKDEFSGHDCELVRQIRTIQQEVEGQVALIASAISGIEISRLRAATVAPW